MIQQTTNFPINCYFCKHTKETQNTTKIRRNFSKINNSPVQSQNISHRRSKGLNDTVQKLNQMRLKFNQCLILIHHNATYHKFSFNYFFKKMYRRQ